MDCVFELFGKRLFFALISLASSSPSSFSLIFLDVHLPKPPLAVGLEAIGCLGALTITAATLLCGIYDCLEAVVKGVVYQVCTTEYQKISCRLFAFPGDRSQRQHSVGYKKILMGS